MSVQAFPDQSTNYTVEVEDILGCKNTDTVQVEIGVDTVLQGSLTESNGGFMANTKVLVVLCDINRCVSVSQTGYS